MLFQPLGPGFASGSRYNYRCNALVLPNAQGYLLSGTADSLVSGTINPVRQAAYIVRLDTALRVVWTYRHPAAANGTGAISTHANRLRWLPNNTAGLMLSDVRGAGTPDAFLAQGGCGHGPTHRPLHPQLQLAVGSNSSRLAMGGRWYFDS